MQVVSSINFLGVQLTSRLAQSLNSETLVKWTEQQLHSLHNLKKHTFLLLSLPLFIEGHLKASGRIVLLCGSKVLLLWTGRLYLSDLFSTPQNISDFVVVLILLFSMEGFLILF